MLDKLKSMTALASLLKDRERIQQITERVKQVSENVRASGEAGGGVVRVVVNGQMKLLQVDLAPALVAGMHSDERTRELAGNLICQATAEAQQSAQARMKDVIAKEMRDLGLPEDMGDFSKLLGG